jgi:hypothetical protein
MSIAHPGIKPPIPLQSIKSWPTQSGSPLGASIAAALARKEHTDRDAAAQTYKAALRHELDGTGKATDAALTKLAAALKTLGITADEFSADVAAAREVRQAEAELTDRYSTGALAATDAKVVEANVKRDEAYATWQATIAAQNVALSENMQLGIERDKRLHRVAALKQQHSRAFE